MVNRILCYRKRWHQGTNVTGPRNFLDTVSSWRLCFSIYFAVYFLLGKRHYVTILLAVYGWGCISNSSNSKKFRYVRMSGKLAKISEKSDFEIFVMAMQYWANTEENHVLEFTSRKKKNPSILLRSEVTNLFSLSEEVGGGWLLAGTKGVRRAEPRLALQQPPPDGVLRMYRMQWKQRVFGLDHPDL